MAQWSIDIILNIGYLVNINTPLRQHSKGLPKSKHAFHRIMLSHKDCGNIMKNGG